MPHCWKPHVAAHILGHKCLCEFGHDMVQSQTKDQPMTSRYRNTRIKRIKHQDMHAMLYSTVLKCSVELNTFLVLTIVKHIMKCYLGFKYLALHHISI